MAWVISALKYNNEWDFSNRVLENDTGPLNAK